MSELLPELQPGSVLRDVYRVERRLGAGVHGAVYRVHHRFLGIQALKLLWVQKEGDVEYVLREARILARLLHPHIVRVFDANLLDLPEGKFPFLTMEYLPSGTLADLLKERLRLEVPAALAVATQVLEGLAVAHSLQPPILHRDLIPSNILVVTRAPLAVKIGDFGLASEAHPVTGLTRVGGVVRYLPPESMWGYATTSGDLYAIALILYEMLTGASAYPIPTSTGEGNFSEVMEAILKPRRIPPLAPSRFRRNLGPAIDGLIVKALSPDPKDRFPDVVAFSAAVRAVSRLEAET